MLEPRPVNPDVTGAVVPSRDFFIASATLVNAQAIAVYFNVYRNYDTSNNEKYKEEVQ